MMQNEGKMFTLSFLLITEIKRDCKNMFCELVHHARFACPRALNNGNSVRVQLATIHVIYSVAEEQMSVACVWIFPRLSENFDSR